ncbi:nucleoside-triphosphate diphosphatase [Streptococcus pluranimalium]|uniref:nucleoside-triphosphate diphosphatase n=1 Tax=Streptococcus pluranimalium TaxID=82348 RepID=UPI00241588AB|nr:nucleoside-triphosphate diphosphatase [Streptococcus pluranimalium]WFM80181.1 nucleoside-triphosphate diphosphatase [Streptococcus pluranimalium]
MTHQIYEYKDDQNWFIGKWADFNYLTCFGNDTDYEKSQDIFHSLLKRLGVESLQVHIAQLSSDVQLIAFLVDVINQEMKRNLHIKRHQGAVLVTEADQLLAVHLPDGGIEVNHFFGTGMSDFGDKLLIATHNEGKVKEFRKMFASLGIEVESLNDYPDLPEVEETGMTFEENARLKAETIAKLTGRMVLADDSGLKVDALGGLPGVWSARFSAPEPTDAKNNAKLLHELAIVLEQEDRSAQFHSTLVVAAPDKESLVVAADWPGYIAFELKGEDGFGYDPLFLVGETGRTAAQLSPEEKNAISHRGLAMKKLMEEFPTWQNKH